MKIKKEHYQYMLEQIKSVPYNLAAAEAEYAKRGLSEKRFRWDVAYSAKLISWFCHEIYPYANDDHIDTALRKIITELTA